MKDSTSQSIDQAVQEYVKHHTMANPHEWNLPFLPTIHLPPWLSLHAVMLILGSVFLILIFGVLYRKHDDVPRGITNFLESFIYFVRDQIAIPNLGEEDGKRFTPLLCSLFFYILVLNFMGLIPLFATATANINVTAGLALITLMFMIGGGIVRNGPLGFIKTFMPSGVPWPILIMLFPIEVVGMFVKPFALSVRLFANMLAGHVVLFSLIGLAVMFGIWGVVPALIMAAAIYMLEIFVALLQAFIFTMLSAIFIGSFLHPAH
jgi:F-type H+-transporting ATPase subunit a